MADLIEPYRIELDLSTPGTYDPITSHLAAWCSYHAYYDDPAKYYVDILGANYMGWIKPAVSGTVPQGWILELDECFVVVFAGTTNYQQLYNQAFGSTFWWSTNLNGVGRVGTPWGKMADRIYADWHVSFKARFGSKKVLLCGHSLGGAIATVLAASLGRSGDYADGQLICYSFGSQRCGNKAFAAALRNCFNVVTNGDIVPRVPHLGFVNINSDVLDANERSVTPTDPFWPHGTVVEIETSGRAKIVNGNSFASGTGNVEWDMTTLFLESFSKPLEPIGSRMRDYWNYHLKEHAMGEYLADLEKGLPPGYSGSGGDFSVESEKVEKAVPLDPQPLPTPVTLPKQLPIPTVDPGTVPFRGRRHF